MCAANDHTVERTDLTICSLNQFTFQFWMNSATLAARFVLNCNNDTLWICYNSCASSLKQWLPSLMRGVVSTAVCHIKVMDEAWFLRNNIKTFKSGVHKRNLSWKKKVKWESIMCHPHTLTETFHISFKHHLYKLTNGQTDSVIPGAKLLASLTGTIM